MEDLAGTASLLFVHTGYDVGDSRSSVRFLPTSFARFCEAVVIIREMSQSIRDGSVDRSGDCRQSHSERKGREE